MRNLVYFSPVASHPVGGIKVFYRHTEQINGGLGGDRWRAQVYHWTQPGFSCDWFGHRAALKQDAGFDPRLHFAVLPECHLWDFWRQLSQHGVHYAIFVQNGYLIGGNPQLSHDDLLQAYRKASLIFTISDDTAECVRLVAPDCAHKIVPVRYPIPSALFHGGDEKETLITYMPRKMPDHARLLRLFLQRGLPTGWRLMPLDGIPEAEVAAALRRSSVFLSFCGFEGLPMPPAEAALCGNHVVGYTGQGGLDYWHPDLFTEVPMGDIRGFARAVLELVERLEARQRLGLPRLSEPAQLVVESLRVRFSEERTGAGLARLLERVDEVMDLAALPR